MAYEKGLAKCICIVPIVVVKCFDCTKDVASKKSSCVIVKSSEEIYSCNQCYFITKSNLAGRNISL